MEQTTMTQMTTQPETTPAVEKAPAPATPPLHRMARLGAGPAPRRFAWWRQLVEVVVALVAVVVGVVLLALALELLLSGVDYPGKTGRILEEETDMNDPGQLLFGLGIIAVAAPALLLAVAVSPLRRAGTLVSSTGRFGWGRLGQAMLVSLAVIGPVFVVQQVASMALSGDWTLNLDPATLLAGGAALLVVPLQAAAEELIFRGLLPQIVGAWIRNPFVAYLPAGVLFVLGHTYNLVGLVDIGLFAVCTALLAWRTGGLEAPIGLHVVNNLVVFGAGPLFGGDSNTTEVSVATVLISSGSTLLATWLLYRDRSLRR